MSRWANLVTFAALTSILLATPALAQDSSDTGWTITSFDTDVEVLADGRLQVTETIDVDFADLQRRGIFRVIPVSYPVTGDPTVQIPEDREPDDFRRMIRIDEVDVTSTAPPDVTITETNPYTIRVGEENTYVTGRQSYTIRYTVTGALRDFGDSIDLSWNSTGHDWPVPILRATATVRAPDIIAAACFRGPVGSTTTCDGAVQGRQATYLSQELGPGQGMTIGAELAAGAVDVPPPILQEQWRLDRALTGSPLTYPLTGLTALLGFAGVGWLGFRQGRDRVTRGGVTVDGHVDEPVRRGLFSPRDTPVQFRPPDDLRPAQLGLIVDERVDPVDVSATIVDLAVRGHLVIEETNRGKLIKRRDWLLKETGAPRDDLLGYERHLLTKLFASGDEVSITEIKGDFAEPYQQVCKQLYTDSVKRGWFPRNPDTTRTMWLGIGLLATAAAGGIAFLALRYTTFGLAAVPLVVAGLVLTMSHRKMPHRTAKGSRLLAETLGFKEFVTTAEAGRMDFAEAENMFVRYLPYAVVFGVVDRWAERFAEVGAAAVTGGALGWYVGSGGRGDFSSLADGLSSFSHSVGSNLSTVPSSSGSGGGGGSSGGGFGGGGGGSW